MKKLLLTFFLVLPAYFVMGQTTNDLLNLLITNKNITQEQADSIRAEYAIKQQSNLPDKHFQLTAEYRPRAEFRNGYQQLRNDTTVGAFFVSQRSRLAVNYVQENKFTFQFTLQDLRVWGQQDPKSTAATMQVFEAWAEPYLTPDLSVRIGRQRIIFDNSRLFAENDWRIGGAAMDALDLRYNKGKLNSDLVFAFNQLKENYFGTDYSPSTFTNFKSLVVSHIKYGLSDHFTLTLINSADGYQDIINKEKINQRFTDGGRIEFEQGPFYATVSGYYQSGKNATGNTLSAWYIQPEIRYNVPVNLTVRLGVEVFSGNDLNSRSSTDHCFVPLYGSSHSFNGSMDLITKFPADYGSSGLINPYLFFSQVMNKKLELKSNFHTFSLLNDYYHSAVNHDKYLGFENDWLLCYKPNSSLKLDLGISYMLPTKTFAEIKGGDSKFTLSWVYLALSFKPTLFSATFK